MAAPSPWTTRAATKPGSVFAIPQKAEPTVKTTMAAQNTSRAPNRSAAQPPGRMKTATVSR